MTDSPQVAIALRPVQISDLNLLKYWDEKPHVIASNPNDKWDWKTELQNPSPGREQFIAQINGRPIGFMEITNPALDNSNYWDNVGNNNIRAIDIWLGEETDLGKGYGTKMMQLALAKCFAISNVTAVLVDPLANNLRAHRFYQRLGFQLVEKRKFGQDDCFVFRLDRLNWNN